MVILPLELVVFELLGIAFFCYWLSIFWRCGLYSKHTLHTFFCDKQIWYLLSTLVLNEEVIIELTDNLDSKEVLDNIEYIVGENDDEVVDYGDEPSDEKLAESA